MAVGTAMRCRPFAGSTAWSTASCSAGVVCRGPEDVGAEVELGPREDLFESEDAIHLSEEDSLFNFRGHLHYYTIVLPLSFNILQT